VSFEGLHRKFSLAEAVQNRDDELVFINKAAGLSSLPEGFFYRFTGIWYPDLSTHHSYIGPTVRLREQTALANRTHPDYLILHALLNMCINRNCGCSSQTIYDYICELLR